jgi:hypothetical protein
MVGTKSLVTYQKWALVKWPPSLGKGWQEANKVNRIKENGENLEKEGRERAMQR